MIPVPFGFIGRNSGFNPATHGTVAYWLNPEALGFEDEDVTDALTDSSGNGNNATQATFGKRGIYSAAGINGRPAVGLDGVDDIYGAGDSSSLHFGDKFFLIAVIKRASVGAAGEQVILDGQASGSFSLQINTDDKLRIVRPGIGQLGIGNTSIDTEAHIIGWYKDGSTNRVFLDGAEDQGSISNQTIGDANALIIGGIGYYAGNIGDVVVYSDFTAETPASVFAALAAKYAITLS